ncbi:MAG TPA: hypothetical protein VHL58_18820 [Thermoanaerobaculia bacterium]|nr:hypothetical protein [Thermoanaerobaculia bacterium]
MTDDELKPLFDALRQDNAAAQAETRRDFRETADRLAAENAATRQENAAMHAETRRHFDVAVERLEKRFDTLGETVEHLDEKLDRTRASLDETIDRTAAETQAMIKFSHKELDRRMTALEVSQRTLEDTVADLQVRLERLEGSTH